MSAIVYENGIDIQTEAIVLNGEYGAIGVFTNQDTFDEADEVAVFQNAATAYDFIDQLERKLAEAGYSRDEDS